MKRIISLVSAVLIAGGVHAQSAGIQTAGTTVVVPAYGQVEQANDRVVVTFMVEEQDKDRVAATSRVNQKMKQGADILKKEDPSAQLQTRGYFTYAVYADEPLNPKSSGAQTQQRKLLGWRVGQYIDAKITNLEKLPQTVAAAQSVLSLNGVQFGLQETTLHKLEEARIAAAYRNLNERLEAIAKAMGRNVSDIVLDTVDFEGSGNYVSRADAAPRMFSAKAMSAEQVEEPSFEPGVTTLNMQVVGRARFK